MCVTLTNTMDESNESTGWVGDKEMVWYGMVWYGMVWYGMVWYGTIWSRQMKHGLNVHPD
jgi:hypothetical protein